MAEQKGNNATDKPLVKTLKTLSTERGVDPALLKKEAIEAGALLPISGIDMINVVTYDDFVYEKLAKVRPKKKRKPRKKIQDSDNIGVLEIHRKKLPEQISKAETDINKSQLEIRDMDGGIDKKQALIALKKREKELVDMKNTQSEIDKRLNFLLDLQLGEDDATETDEDKKQEEN